SRSGLIVIIINIINCSISSFTRLQCNVLKLKCKIGRSNCYRFTCDSASPLIGCKKPEGISILRKVICICRILPCLYNLSQYHRAFLLIISKSTGTESLDVSSNPSNEYKISIVKA
ncbi:hypothetical protein L9F63_016697, partial [Diploptera punctata]